MDKFDLYKKIAERKIKKEDFNSYNGNNGRVNKCEAFMRNGKIRTGGTLLDIGGGIGDLGFAVRDLFKETIVADISCENLKAAFSKGNKIIEVDIDKNGIDLENESVDTITALDFIEHIIDPENFARVCHRLLKPSGEVFINTPNIRFWRHIWSLLSLGKFPHTSGDKEVYHGGHLAFYTYSDLREIFEPAGFTSVQQFKDDECYEQAPNEFLAFLKIKDQKDYVALNLELGCPNLLYKAIKP